MNVLCARLAVPYDIHTMRFDRQSPHKHNSAGWHAQRSGLTIGSSQAAAVYNGVSTTVPKVELLRKLKGEHTREASTFVRMLMDRGTKMEPLLRKEFAELTGCCVFEPNMFVVEERICGGVKEISTPDGIARWSADRYALVEIKYRAGSAGDCGWPGERSESYEKDCLGITVWCQAQHQMRITGIHSAFVYSGSPNGTRRLWHIRYCELLHDRYYFPHLQDCVVNGGRGGLPTREIKHALYMLLARSSSLVLLQAEASSST
jgi:hypothetical protein